MAKITPKEMKPVAVEISKNQEHCWNYWKSVRSARSLYLKDGLNSSELLKELSAAKQMIKPDSGSGKKGKQLWKSYIEKALKENEAIDYVDQYLEAFKLNGFKVPTKEMVEAASNSKKVVKKAKLTPKEMKPVAVEISKDLDSNWNYMDSVKTVRRMYLKWTTVSSDILRELYIAKQAITNNGTRKSGLPKKGKMSWNRYIEEVFGGMISKRTIDSHLVAYEQNGFQKPEKLTVPAISDHNKVFVKSAAKEVDGRIKLEIRLPEFDVTYIQYINA